MKAPIIPTLLFSRKMYRFYGIVSVLTILRALKNTRGKLCNLYSSANLRLSLNSFCSFVDLHRHWYLVPMQKHARLPRHLS